MSQQPSSETGIGSVFLHLEAHSKEREEEEQRGFIRRLWGNVVGLGRGKVALVMLGLLPGPWSTLFTAGSLLSLPLPRTKLKPQAQSRSLNKLAQPLSPNARRCWFQLSSDVVPLSGAFWRCEAHSDIAPQSCIIPRPSGWLALGHIFDPGLSDINLCLFYSGLPAEQSYLTLSLLKHFCSLSPPSLLLGIEPRSCPH